MKFSVVMLYWLKHRVGIDTLVNRSKFIKIEELTTIRSILSSDHNIVMLNRGKWYSGIEYNVLDVVVYRNQWYCCINSHRSFRFKSDRCMWYIIASNVCADN